MLKKFKTQIRSTDCESGTYRILFEWLDDEIYIDVTEADNRGDIYKKC